MTLGSGGSTSITQYGVQTPDSSTVLIVSTDRATAEHALEWIQNGRIVARTITTSTWTIDTEEHDHPGIERAG